MMVVCVSNGKVVFEADLEWIPGIGDRVIYTDVYGTQCIFKVRHRNFIFLDGGRSKVSLADDVL